MWLEILLAMLSNFTLFFGAIAVVGTCVFTFLLVVGLVEGYEKLHWQLMCISFVFLLFAWFVAAIPSVDDLWKVRIGLIKLQLASPENIEKGAEVIERLGKKLECKYLGCDEAEEEK